VFASVAAVVVLASAGCTHTTVNVGTNEEFQKAIKNAQPGTNIVLSHMSLSRVDAFEVHGEEDCPIVISCEEYRNADVLYGLNISYSSFVTFVNMSFLGPVDSYGKYVTFDTDYVFLTGAEGFRFHGAHHVTVRNCTFEALVSSAVLFTSTSNSLVEKCKFTDGLHSDIVSFCQGSNDNVISENVFCNPHFDQADDTWIKLNQCSGNEISRNAFIFDGKVYSKYGIVNKDSTNTLLKQNLFELNQGMVGFYVSGSGANNTVCNSNIALKDGVLAYETIDYSC